jgi:hypothetical protein
VNAKRKQVQDYIFKILKQIDLDGYNTKLYTEKFKAMSDKAFDSWMKDIRDRKYKLTIYIPNMKNNVTMQHITNTAKAVGLTISDHLWMEDSTTGMKYKTNHKYLILRMPIRRVKQYLDAKISVPESDIKTDLLTGQVIKPDKGSSISLIEMQTLVSKGLDKSIIEFMKVRGGDVHAYSEFKSKLEETGNANLSDLSTDSVPRSVMVAETYLRGMHIDNNLSGA